VGADVMTLKLVESQVKFLTDNRGIRTHAVIPLKEYEELLEDLHDLATAHSRMNEEDIPVEEAFQRLDQNEAV